MAKVVGYKQELMKQVVCYQCTAIIQYAPIEEKPSGQTDEGTKIVGITCPECNTFCRTNP